MLKETRHRHDRSPSRATRVVAIALLVAVGMATAAFRGLAPARGAETSNVAAAASESIAQRFDLSYMSPDAVGVWAMRPAAISRLPGLKPHFDRLTNEIAQALPNGLLPNLESIEQVIVEFSVSPRDRSKKIPGRLATGDWMVRSVEATTGG